jgi:hypothetical protein
MVAIDRLAALACLVVATVVGSAPTVAGGASVEWHNVSYFNPTSPPPFAVSPTNPTPGDIVNFVASTDGKMYGNSCWASVAKGEPGISVDSTNRMVVVRFSDPRTNQACPLVVIPVMGIDGQFGRLAAGSWVFNLVQSAGTNSYAFEVEEIPGQLSIQVLGADRYKLSWPTNGGSFALEFNNDLSSTNWDLFGYGPIPSSNRYTMEISSSADFRFFRLRRISP